MNTKRHTDRIIVAIIGSTKFKQEQLGFAQKLTLAGHIVLLSGFWHHVDPCPISDAQKATIDQLILDRIDLADKVLVVCPNGYIGQSTQSGIDHAKAAGKPITYTEEPVAFDPASP